MIKSYKTPVYRSKSVQGKPVEKKVLQLYLYMLLISTCACSSLRESSKYQFSEGIYKITATGTTPGRVYVDITEDTLTMYPMVTTTAGIVLDTLNKTVFAIPVERETQAEKAYTFSKPSFDIDVLTIPLKYRPGTAGIPHQLNTSFQGAVYLGVRNDLFRIRYKNTPLRNYRRSFNHFGYSIGFFTGLGSSLINESFTSNQLAYEYDGVVFLNGVAGIIGLNNFTPGLAVGTDHLLDKNRQDWIYQHKPWVGLVFGLNLN
ncbi:hypothetical protein [Pontibacter sp. SGAir0037]|uniref:hypothetical protein n=1 Tax=Pontibacter sp. SGAir0037 TaxID=2571030 RepID=UPI0010CCDC77|nr:hypothetical protein [Pontibacter sp. SGAir0037]QCR21996.1 hypothetical protein C1N53_06360 [Pontibacter sp. SGAir0037]